MGDQPQEIIDGKPGPSGPSGIGEHPHPVGETARVVQEICDGDRIAVIRRLWEILADVVVETQLTGLLQQEHREGRKRLGGDRGQLEAGRWGDRNAVLDVGEPVGPRENHFAATGQDDRTAWRVRHVPLREELVYPAYKFGCSLLRTLIGAQTEGHSDE